MKKHKLSSLIITFCSVILLVVLTLLVPGISLDLYSDSLFGTANQVPPEYYANYASSISIMASKQLTDYERILLVSGLWDCVVTEETEIKGSEEYQIVTKAKNELNNLADAGLYPYRIEEGEMYYWDVKNYTCVESNFNTLSTKYWIIKLVRYDNLVSHNILITDEGIILNIEYNGTPSDLYVHSLEERFRYLSISEGRLCSYTAFDKTDSVLSYRDLPLPGKIDRLGVITLGSYWVQTRTSLDEIFENNYESYEFYSVLQCIDEDESGRCYHYVFQMIPYATDSTSINYTSNNAIQW